MWRRLSRETSEPGWRRFDVRDPDALNAALRSALPLTAGLTLYMCWHEGKGHDYPAHVMQAASRLRERHGQTSSSDGDYTSLTFSPSANDWEDVGTVVPYCDLAYATDDADDLVWEVSGQGESASVRDQVEGSSEG